MTKAIYKLMRLLHPFGACNDRRRESGQMLLLVFVAMGVVLFTVLFVIGGAQVYFQNAQYSVESEKATALAEAGVDKALIALNTTGGSYNGETETAFGQGSFSVTVTNKDAATKILQVTGYVPDKAKPKSKKTITVQASKGAGISFNYGLQVGEGGLSMGNSSAIKGSIYSNGNITAGSDTHFDGDVYIAGGGQSVSDQQSDCFGVNCQDYIFGRNVSGENRQDVAQAFRPAASGILNKVSLKLKKTGSPANPTVRIMTDSGGKPNKNGVLATGTLSASTVTGEYSFVDITFGSSPNLSSSATYWIMVHSAALDDSSYWMWSSDLAQGYTQGQAKWSNNWQSQNPDWTTISKDLGFQTYMGGAVTSINLQSGSSITGDVHANTINGNFTVAKDAYYQAIDASVIVQGDKFPGSPDPAPVVFPISEANITDWKNQAEQAGVTTGNITGCPSVLGPGKIVGNVTLNNSCNVRIISPVWITGEMATGNSTTFTLDSSFGSSSGMVIVDGITEFGNGSNLLGTGIPGSYLMLLSTYDSRSNNNEAIVMGNGANNGIIFAPLGLVSLPNGADIKELTAWKIVVGNGFTLTYQTGLASTFFNSGPGGTFSLVKGTYQAK